MKVRMRSFFDEENRMVKISKIGDPLEVLNAIINWEMFRDILSKHIVYKESNKGGRPPFDQVMMFKILVLERLYNLSDDQAEFQINDRRSFMRFLRLESYDSVPDAKTIWKFRDDLSKTDAIEECFHLFNELLAKEGLIDMSTLIIDAKSGTSGAGRGAKLPNLYCEVNENIKAYGVATHRHTPEIEEQLGYAAGEKVVLNFTPHLVPMNRGILATEYAKLTKKVTYEEVKAIYDKYYADEKFVRVLEKDQCPETKWVEGSNYVDIGFKIDERTGRIIMMGAIDNLVKGAAGQAVQNMNLLFGLPESEGLELVPMFP